jgi:hypothetical protein
MLFLNKIFKFKGGEKHKLRTEIKKAVNLEKSTEERSSNNLKKSRKSQTDSQPIENENSTQKNYLIEMRLVFQSPSSEHNS